MSRSQPSTAGVSLISGSDDRQARGPPLPAALDRRRDGRLLHRQGRTTGTRSPTSISRRSRADAQRRTCLPATRPGASRPTSPSSRSCWRAKGIKTDSRPALLKKLLTKLQIPFRLE